MLSFATFTMKYELVLKCITVCRTLISNIWQPKSWRSNLGDTTGNITLGFNDTRSQKLPLMNMNRGHMCTLTSISQMMIYNMDGMILLILKFQVQVSVFLRTSCSYVESKVQVFIWMLLCIFQLVEILYLPLPQDIWVRGARFYYWRDHLWGMWLLLFSLHLV